MHTKVRENAEVQKIRRRESTSRYDRMRRRCEKIRENAERVPDSTRWCEMVWENVKDSACCVNAKLQKGAGDSLYTY